MKPCSYFCDKYVLTKKLTIRIRQIHYVYYCVEEISIYRSIFLDVTTAEYMSLVSPFLLKLIPAVYIADVFIIAMKAARIIPSDSWHMNSPIIVSESRVMTHLTHNNYGAIMPWQFTLDGL